MTKFLKLKRPADYRLGRVRPPPQRGQHAHLGCQQRYPDQQHGDIAQKNHHGRKQVPLVGDIGLLVLQNMPGQGQMETVGRTERQMEPDEVMAPVPEPITQRENCRDRHGVDREKVGGQGNQKIVPRNQ